MKAARSSGSLMVLFLLAVGLASGAALAAAGGEPVALTPRPKQIAWSAEPPVPLAAGKVAIVLGERAIEPERQAARMLRERVAVRFGHEWPVVTEDHIPAGANTLVLLGQRSTHALLNAACEKNGIRIDGENPGHDGYVIHVLTDGTRRMVLVGGSNARGVIYGQDTLFQMVGRHGNEVVLRPATVRDWPTVPWRGRPQTHYKHYLEPGAMDCYMTSRINWIDLRESVYAFEPDSPLEKDVLEQVIELAHARDLVVYGAVNCGVPVAKREAVLKMFREFIELGVDGLTLSFDDKGPGEEPERMVWEVLELARAHGIEGRRIAVAPPKGSYQEIDTPFNRRLIAIPGMEEAMILWTRVPCAEDAATAASIGLACKPGWWHNWTRPASGFTHIESNSLHVAGRRSYMPVPTMAEGWHAPGYEQLSVGGPFCESVMPWGGQGWGQYYIVPVIGWWGWAPEQHDFDATRRRIYDIVYGPEQVENLRRFDDGLTEVRKLFAYPVAGSEWLPLGPARLKRLEERDKALSLLDELQQLAVKIAASAGRGSLIAPEAMNEWYVAAMQDEIEIGRAEATANYPEYWWADHQRAVLNAVYDGDTARADAAIQAVRPRLLADLAVIEEKLAGLRLTPAYVSWWREVAGLDAAGWAERMAKRRRELAARVWWYGYAVEKLADMLAGVDSPPLGHGTGRWERQNLVLASVLPDEREQYWGDWMAGLYRSGEREAAVFAFRHRTEGAPGAFAELPVTVPLTGDRSRLGLMIFLSNADKDTIGLHHVPRRWAGHRRIQLLHDGQAVWEADLGLPRPQGEWFVVRLPELPADLNELKLALRVEDLRKTRAHAIAFVGPIRLVQLPE
ncbi:MAG TPA: glycoside hydrolase family 20 zincin-like fold domain-containing protein [Phycisphaerae bacterium]|nr:glycoside hydrolase family 20 zincin-like fold domain-containing protein [Phycisphaerae bacterium]HQE27549.1 glycoside hydrolase family 20 zincin-like fold domain-containing protein [Phycisphaerae bacterium]